MHSLNTKTIREIALETPATTRVFEEFKIDYCCGGNRSISDACIARGIDEGQLWERIDQAIKNNETSESIEPEHLQPSHLATYIVSKHHTFTMREIERLTPLMAKVALKHGGTHPELYDLQGIFTSLAESLVPHMKKEENILFPYIEELEMAIKSNLPQPVSHFGTVQNPIRMMMAEHDVDGERLRQMRELTNDYALPEGACPSFTALYAGLQDLERDLNRHIHLENNVLFPAAAQLEARGDGVRFP
jgi:regulator of cell morphogenesis and NO signaling